MITLFSLLFNYNLSPFSPINRQSSFCYIHPADWMNSFGNNYYTQSQAPELTEFTVDKNWQTASESKPYKEPELQTTPKETIIQNIKNIITEIKGDTQ